MRFCACGCGNSIDHLRSDAKYYSDSCRTAAYKKRNGIVTKTPQRVTHCQYNKCDQPIIGRRADARYCCSNHQKLDFHFKKEAKIAMIINLIGKKK